MFTELIESARELRSPLVVGYSLLFTVWLTVGERIDRAVAGSPLASRLRDGFHELGSAGKVALVTFAAAMLGGLVWNVVVERVIERLKLVFHHPDWDAWIMQALEQVRRYEEYTVVSHQSANWNSRDTHRVPSPHYGAFLQAQVDDRMRRSSEVTFRMALAVSSLPAALALAAEGGGYWWFALLVPALVWLDVFLIKHTAASLIRGYEVADLTEQLNQCRRALANAKKNPEASNQAERARQLELEIEQIEARLDQLNQDASRPVHRTALWLRGAPSAPSAQRIP